ncbi:hypothetical protein D3C77_499060 [compost metagenome]
MALHLVDGIDRGKLNAQAFGASHQCGVAQKQPAVTADQRGLGFLSGYAVGGQANTGLEGTHSLFGGGAEVTVNGQGRLGAGLVELLLQLANGLATVAVT